MTQPAPPSRVVVTGGAGFVGSHLVDALVARGRAVTVLDDLSRGRASNLAAARARGDVTLLLGSVGDEAAVERAMEGAGHVFHLAAPVGVARVLEDPAAALTSIVGGAEVVLRQASRRGCPVLFTSSSEVYGPAAAGPSRESDRPVLAPPDVHRWSYAAAKLAAEHLCMAHHAHRGLPVTIVRLFNAVGPRQDPEQGMVLPRFVAQALAGEPLTVYGSGSQRRSFCDVRDVTAALERLSRCPRAAGRVLNVGSADPLAIESLARRVGAALGIEVELRRVPYEAAYGAGFEDVSVRCPDLTQLRALIDFAPGIPLERTIGDLAGELAARSRRAAEGSA